jgi:NhaP-type Na+/H+ or K+/H+ antiporter
VYYLAFAIQHGVEGWVAERLAGLTFATVAASVLLHGVSVTPLMKWYERRTPATPS